MCSFIIFREIQCSSMNEMIMTVLEKINLLVKIIYQVYFKFLNLLISYKWQIGGMSPLKYIKSTS